MIFKDARALVVGTVLSAGALLDSSVTDAQATELRRFTVRDSVEMARFGAEDESQPDWLDDDGITSPDGRWVVKITHRGVLPEGVTEGTIWLFDATAVKKSLQNLALEVPKPSVLVLMSAAVNGIGFIAERENTICKPAWVDEGRSLAFLGRDGHENRQLYRVDVATRTAKALTPADQNVVDYVWSNGVFTYLAGANVQAERDWWSTGPGVPDIVDGAGSSLLNLLYPHSSDSYHETVDLQLWQVRENRAIPILAAGSDKALTLTTRYAVETMGISPDGKLLATIASDGSRPPALPDMDPHDVALGLQYRLIDLAKGTDVPLLTTRVGSSESDRYRAEWSPRGDAVAVTETFVGQGAAEGSADRRHCDVAIVTWHSQRTQCLEITKDKKRGFLYSVHWQTHERELQVRFRQFGADLYSDRVFRHKRATWEVTNRWMPPNDLPLELTVREALDAPPVLVATDPDSGGSRTLFDPNPQLRQINLGSVRIIQWHDEHGRTIRGGLVLPPGYVQGKRYPLVIQTHGFDPDAFLDAGGGASTSHAARAIAARDIVVLQAGEAWEPYWRTWQDSRENGTKVYLAAIDRLASDGLIDPTRVGISGYSATGRQVSDAITFAADRFAVAALANTDPVSLFNYFAFVDAGPHQREIAEAVDAGAKPYGDGLAKWIERSPAFSTDKIRAPVLLTAADPNHLIHLWSLYAALRDQGKPVDLQYIRSGSHVIKKPLQKLAHQEALVVWFDFWLNGHEDPDPDKADQYARWRKLREMRNEEQSGK